MGNSLKNHQIIWMVIIIIVLVIVVVNLRTQCPRREFYQEIDTLSSENTQAIDDTITGNTIDIDEETKEQLAIGGVDPKAYQDLVEREEEAAEKIRSSFQGEMVYTSTNPFNTVPLGQSRGKTPIKCSTQSSGGYTYLPPENWFRAYEQPPVCITDRQSVVHPSADPSTAGLLEYDAFHNTHSLQINEDYVRDVLNNNS